MQELSINILSDTLSPEIHYKECKRNYAKITATAEQEKKLMRELAATRLVLDIKSSNWQDPQLPHQDDNEASKTMEGIILTFLQNCIASSYN